MKLDKEQQKHFAETIRNASKKKGFKVKGCSIYDDIFWKVLQMPSNSKQADSLRAVGAFKAPSILIEKGQDIKQELLHRYKTILPDELIMECSHDFIKNYDIDEYVVLYLTSLSSPCKTEYCIFIPNSFN